LISTRLGMVWFGYLASVGCFKHFKLEFAAVKREVGLLSQLLG